MTKKDMVQLVYDKLGLSKGDSVRIVETFLDIIKEAIVNGEKVKISGFGNFETKDKRSRRGRNPKTGESMEITARRVLVFKSSNVLRDMMNER
ncbi:MAG: integration host factor subunit alpha [Deltaproteobacteria bacterium]|nr:integration host factor subunit alpha [Deltaproteobacteria bacterium]